MAKAIAIILTLMLMGCSAKGIRYSVKDKNPLTGEIVEKDVIELKGWGSKKAKWSDGCEIERDEPISIPELPEIHYKRED